MMTYHRNPDFVNMFTLCVSGRPCALVYESAAGGWSVEIEDGSHDRAVFDTKNQAMDYAEEEAAIRYRDSVGLDYQVKRPRARRSGRP